MFCGFRRKYSELRLLRGKTLPLPLTISKRNVVDSMQKSEGILLPAIIQCGKGFQRKD